MKSLLNRSVLLASLVCAWGLVHGASNEVFSQHGPKNRPFPQQVLIIRHAEKPPAEKDDVHLSETGRERAKLLPTLFVSTTQKRAPFATPDFVFATRDSEKSQRPRETVTPLAMQLKLPIDSDYHNSVTSVNKNGKKVKGINDLRDELFNKTKYAGKTILICWHHGTIPDLAKALRVTDAPMHWKDAVFDRVWKITYDDNGKATFADLPQRLMPGDSPK